MEEQLISFETAKLAKKKGFDLKLNNIYYNGKLDIRTLDEIDNIPDYVCDAPTQSLLQKWLREVHGLHINIDLGIEWGYQLIPIGWEGNKFSQEFIDNINCNSYEEALEKGLQEALKLV